MVWYFSKTLSIRIKTLVSHIFSRFFLEKAGYTHVSVWWYCTFPAHWGTRSSAVGGSNCSLQLEASTPFIEIKRPLTRSVFLPLSLPQCFFCPWVFWVLLPCLVPRNFIKNFRFFIILNLTIYSLRPKISVACAFQEISLTKYIIKNINIYSTQLVSLERSLILVF